MTDSKIHADVEVHNSEKLVSDRLPNKTLALEPVRPAGSALYNVTDTCLYVSDGAAWNKVGLGGGGGSISSATTLTSSGTYLVTQTGTPYTITLPLLSSRLWVRFVLVALGSADVRITTAPTVAGAGTLFIGSWDDNGVAAATSGFEDTAIYKGGTANRGDTLDFSGASATIAYFTGRTTATGGIDTEG
uniref:Uncharacterized protein n=1 Tax=Marseillevirus LCMAC103 TaxID=2506604 RepID=A0A481YVI9_9VIRU|nr:MAG: hypothetical protein LCMAC103_04040 [Marseillevirus LCMAC103]